MFGLYLSTTDEKFLDLLTDELDQFNRTNDFSSILLFPSLTSRHRLILHRLRDSKFPNLISFSLGEEKQTRRTIVCFKSQLMDETITTTTTTSKDADSSINKRRPDQAFYRPPRRSAPVEPTITTPPPVVSEIQMEKETTKVTKTKSARPSAEPYVPPSRRSQTTNVETPTISTRPIPKENLTKQEKTDENDQNDNANDDDDDEEEEEEEEEEWEKLLNKSDDSISKDFVQEIQSKFKDAVQIKKPVQDYSQWTVEELQVKEADLSHVVEVSNFPSSLRTEDLHNAFTTLTRSIFDIKWVDETHALIVFPDPNTALDALQMEHPMFKLSPMSQAAAISKKKAKNLTEFLQPYKTRPQTSSLTANRRICAALGLKNPMSNDKTRTERQKIEAARQQKVRDKEEQKAVWDGEILTATSST